MRLIRSALWISVILLIAGLLSDERSKVVWATPDKPEWDGWVDDVVRLRADRKNQPMVGYLYSEAVVWDGYHDINQSRLADGRKGLRQQIIGGLAGSESFAEGCRQGGEVLVLERLHLRFERIGSIDQALVETQQALVAATKEASEKLEHDEESFRQGMEAT